MIKLQIYYKWGPIVDAKKAGVFAGFSLSFGINRLTPIGRIVD